MAKKIETCPVTYADIRLYPIGGREGHLQLQDAFNRLRIFYNDLVAIQRRRDRAAAAYNAYNGITQSGTRLSSKFNEYDYNGYVTRRRKHDTPIQGLGVNPLRGCVKRLKGALSGYRELRKSKRYESIIAKRKRRGKRVSGVGKPRFKSIERFRTISFQATNSNVKGDKLVLRGYGLGDFRMSRHGRRINGKVKQIAISYKPNGLYASVTCDVPLEQIRTEFGRKPRKVVGIDLGVTDRVTLSTGKRIEGRRLSEMLTHERGGRMRRRAEMLRVESEIKRLQRQIAKCKPRRGEPSLHQLKGRTNTELAMARRRKCRGWCKRGSSSCPCQTVSNNQLRLELQLASLQRRATLAKRNEDHRLTTDLVRTFGRIAMEDLEIRNMTQSAKGTVSEPGRNVKAKAGLNRGIGEQGWGRLVAQMTYKAERAGRELVQVDARNTSRTCSLCQHVDAASRDAKRFYCVSCGFDIDADVNAARNIAISAFGVNAVARGQDANAAVGSPRHGGGIQVEIPYLSPPVPG